ncbi:hypothetical protein ATZ33_14160 [Enterococcus silesiacus]|uniref:Uncharacterized protein n=1 Tax=Enterococcus silesiacus TaxID=332949 RepID=A0A0S3KDU3_9ENTE|nr:A24 family peptidase [Enterococcus silesiacus]ALS02480.1 hypothetical protein ATZ33_14160 [Enterococcus silesiacus]OJG93610.1 hypothetical protein RV15_GL000212 [Enterococcus silesiacus]
MLIIYFICGCVIGSFLCLVAERVPVGKSIVYPASHCSYCQTKLKIFELIPIISILFLRFRCRYCRHQLSWIYFFSELICGLICLNVSFKTIHPLYSLFFLLIGVVLSLTDIFYLIVEPKIFYLLSVILCIGHIYLALPVYLFTSLITFLSLLSLNFIFKNSIGGGDIVILTLWGALIGAKSLIFLLLIASSSGLIFLLFCRFVLKKTIRQLPFVPFLSIGLFVVFLCK